MDTHKLPDGSVALKVDERGGYVNVTAANSHFPPRVEFMRSGRKTKLIPSDLVEKFADELPSLYAIKLRYLISQLRGEPAPGE